MFWLATFRICGSRYPNIIWLTRRSRQMRICIVKTGTAISGVNRNNVIPTSIMLMMDNAAASAHRIWNFAKSSNINFINNSGDADRIGFMRFARNNEAIWFTDDKRFADHFIADTEDDPGTRIYRALIEVVDSMKAGNLHPAPDYPVHRWAK